MITQELLQRYFNNECTPDENRYVIHWLQDDTADHSLLLAMMDEHWDQEHGQAAGEELKAALLQDLQQQFYPAKNTRAVIKPLRRWLWYGAAAAVLVIFLTGLWRWNIGKNGQAGAQMATTTQWYTITNNTVLKKHIVLPDSTQIWLAPGSRMAYAAERQPAERIVHLEGQAFFDVAPDMTRPFLVYAGHIQTKVLGTAFNIEAYGRENEIRISLVKGRVAVQSTTRPAEELQAGEILTYTKTDSSIRKTSLKMNTMAEWTGNRMILNDVPVRAALERITQQYHLTVIYGKDVRLDNKRFSTVFDQETPEQMIQNILFITDYHYHLRGKTLIITQ